MTEDRTGRELEPLPEDRSVTPVLERPTSVERFDAGEQAHTVGLTEERSAKIVRQSGNARLVGLLAVLVVALFIPIYWFYDIGLAALNVPGRLETEGEVQYVTDVSRGYALYLANCARCHDSDSGPPGNGMGGIGPPLNDQAKLYNALTPDRQPGTGHLNPNYLERVLEVGGRYVCGDPNSLMPAWKQPAGPLNYREVEELIAFITASKDIDIDFDPGAHGEGADSEETPYVAHPWRDPNYQPAPSAPTPPACWRNPSGVVGGGGGSGPTPSAAAVESPGTADAPREIPLLLTEDLTITDPNGAVAGGLSVVPGEVVRFDVTNTAGFAHNFFIGPAADLEANATGDLVGIDEFPSGTQTVDWTVPDELGDDVEFACTIPGHYTSMHGAFVVVEPGGQAAPSGSVAPSAGTSAEPAPSGSPELTPSGSPQPSPLSPEPSGSAAP